MLKVAEKRTLGRTGLDVSVLGFGAMELRGPRVWSGRSFTDCQAEAILNAVLDGGINLIDTSNDYGRSEELIGRYISHRREEFILATKCGCKLVPHNGVDEVAHVWSSENLFRGLHESLDRLRTDRIDLMQLHNPKVEKVRDGDLVRVLEEMKRQGKVRWIGCSTTLPDVLTYMEWGVFDAFQIPYSALNRQHEEVITAAANSGAGVVVRGGVARGEPQVGLGREDRWAKYDEAGLDDLRSPGESRTALLLRFLLSHPYMSTTIVGTLDSEHLQENIEATLRGPLDSRTYAEMKRRLDLVGESPLKASAFPQFKEGR